MKPYILFALLLGACTSTPPGNETAKLGHDLDSAQSHNTETGQHIDSADALAKRIDDKAVILEEQP